MYVNHNISPSANQLVNGYTPKSTSKYPFEQTYITTDTELLTSDGNWQFKIPEIFSSSRSGRKSFGCRSIKWLARKTQLHFTFKIQWQLKNKPDKATGTRIDESELEYYKHKYGELFVDSGGTLLSDDDVLQMRTTTYYQTIDATKPTISIVDDIINSLNAYIHKIVGIRKYEDVYYKFTKELDDVSLYAVYEHNTLTFNITRIPSSPNSPEFEVLEIKLKDVDNSLHYVFNQPNNYVFPDEYSDSITLNNVWDRRNLLFHCSLIPFDTYQYLGFIDEEPHELIKYENPNGSSIFNIYATTDGRNKIPIYHEMFIFRFSFIIREEH